MTAPLRALSFIHFARWALIGRWPTDRQTPRDRAAPRSMLFLTSFDGSDVQYIEAFVRVVPTRINGLYWGAKGFPGPRRFGPVDAVHRATTATTSTTSGWPTRRPRRRWSRRR